MTLDQKIRDELRACCTGELPDDTCVDYEHLNKLLRHIEPSEFTADEIRRQEGIFLETLNRQIMRVEHFFGTKEQDYHSLCHQVLVPAAFNSPIDVAVARGPNGAVGIRFMKDECFTLLFVITEIISTGPAFASGLLVAGDVICSIDGQAVACLTLEEGMAMIKGQPGTYVRLNVCRPRRDGTGQGNGRPCEQLTVGKPGKLAVDKMDFEQVHLDANQPCANVPAPPPPMDCPSSEASGFSDVNVVLGMPWMPQGHENMALEGMEHDEDKDSNQDWDGENFPWSDVLSRVDQKLRTLQRYAVLNLKSTLQIVRKHDRLVHQFSPPSVQLLCPHILQSLLGMKFVLRKHLDDVRQDLKSVSVHILGKDENDESSHFDRRKEDAQRQEVDLMFLQMQSDFTFEHHPAGARVEGTERIETYPSISEGMDGMLSDDEGETIARELVVCSQCEERKECRDYCNQCAGAVCLECAAAHRRMKMFRWHNLRVLGGPSQPESPSEHKMPYRKRKSFLPDSEATEAHVEMASGGMEVDRVPFSPEIGDGSLTSGGGGIPPMDMSSLSNLKKHMPATLQKMSLLKMPLPKLEQPLAYLRAKTSKNGNSDSNASLFSPPMFSNGKRAIPSQGKRRANVGSRGACVACKAAHIGCDQGDPCANCVRRGRKCERLQVAQTGQTPVPVGFVMN